MADLTIAENIFRESSSQDLSSAALDFTTSVSTDFRLISIMFNFTLAVKQTITITMDSGLGAAFDTVLGERTLRSHTDVVFVPCAAQQHFKDGTEIKIQCTNDGTPASTVSVLALLEQR